MLAALDAKLDGNQAKTEAACQAMEHRLASQLHEQDSRIRALESKVGSAGVSAGRSSGGAPSGSRSPAAWDVRPGPGVTPMTDSVHKPPKPTAIVDSGIDKTRLWVKGFRRPLMRSQLEQHFQDLLGHLDDPLPEGAKQIIRPGPQAVYAIRFPSEVLANQAYQNFRDLEPDSLTWFDATCNLGKHIRVVKDQKLDDRNAARVISQLWDRTIQALKTAGTWRGSTSGGLDPDNPGKPAMRLMNINRKMWIVQDEEPYLLFSVDDINKEKYTLTFDHENAYHYGILDFCQEHASARRGAADK